VVEINEFTTSKPEKPAGHAENNLRHSLKHVFELLALIYPKDDIIRAYQNLSGEGTKTIAYSIELLDNILRKDIRDYLIPVIDDIPLEDKAKKCRKLLKTLENVEP
jgi:hypothetical protein